MVNVDYQGWTTESGGSITGSGYSDIGVDGEGCEMLRGCALAGIGVRARAATGVRANSGLGHPGSCPPRIAGRKGSAPWLQWRDGEWSSDHP
eukprot:4857776-Pyramimonas_sp.AAC.1